MNTSNAIYLYALSLCKEIKAPEILQIIKYFPNIDALTSASSQLLTQKLGYISSARLSSHLISELPRLTKRSEDIINLHVDKGITPIPISDNDYPPLLKLISNPPLILYVQGNLSILTKTETVAVIGTREPTISGKTIARQVARDFTKFGYVVVSGLAKGIDTAAHLGALDANGFTIAVLGTPLDKIYPAENKPLAQRILSNSGAMLSELALGQSSFRGNFVQRDRIQSGLSLGIIPVQTDIDGGTMHTVRFAEQQKRLIFCPRPLDNEMNLKQNLGVLSLIKAGTAKEFRQNEIDKIIDRLTIHKNYLQDISLNGLQNSNRSNMLQADQSPFRNATIARQGNLPLFSDTLKPEILNDIQKYLHSLGLDSNPEVFDRLVSILRKRLFEK